MAKLAKIVEEVNTETGEVTVIKKSYTTKVKRSESFYMVFPETLHMLFNVGPKKDKKVFLALCELSYFNKNFLYLRPSERRKLQAELGMKPQAFSRSLSNLKKAGLIYIEESFIDINPKVVWKGTSDSRERKLVKEKTEIDLKFKVNANSDKSKDLPESN